MRDVVVGRYQRQLAPQLVGCPRRFPVVTAQRPHRQQAELGRVLLAGLQARLGVDQPRQRFRLVIQQAIMPGLAGHDGDLQQGARIDCRGQLLAQRPLRQVRREARRRGQAQAVKDAVVGQGTQEQLRAGPFQHEHAGRQSPVEGVEEVPRLRRLGLKQQRALLSQQRLHAAATDALRYFEPN